MVCCEDVGSQGTDRRHRVEKGATKAVDHVVKKLTAPQKTQQKARFKAITQPKSNLHNLIAGSGIATIHDFVRTYK